MEIQTIQPFLQYFNNVRERTMRVERCVPPDKLDWSYAVGKFTRATCCVTSPSRNAICGAKILMANRADTKTTGRNSPMV